MFATKNREIKEEKKQEWKGMLEEKKGKKINDIGKNK